MSQQLTLPATTSMVPVARHGVAALLPRFGRLADVELIVTELVVSAIRSADAHFTVTVEHSTNVRVEIRDQRGRHPRADAMHLDPDAPDGLAIVSAVADRFGSRRHRSGDVTTWAVVSP
ncbi:ATP-binding protein [Nocardiopsis aegyptia]|uniref:ATP-binding protein n=1 Tax=Nocardiopsis aegyptia TaxID=220378 RepID=UPI00366D4C15